jgi:hypothetical protein
MPTLDDDDDDFDDEEEDDDVTVFEPTPWGAKQRVMPRMTFKAAVSKIITLVPSLVRELPPPIPARPALAAPTFAAPAFAAPAFAAPAFAAPPLPAPAFAAPMFAAQSLPAHVVQTWPVKRVRALQLKRILAAFSGAVLVLLGALIVQRVRETPPPRAHVGASLARSLTTDVKRERDDHAVVVQPVAISVTPIEPTVPDAADAPTDEAGQAQPIAKKRSRLKKPRRIVAGDTSTPLGGLRPRAFR